MAWETTHWALLVLLASASCAQDPAQVFLEKREGETLSVTCPYQTKSDWANNKVWCKNWSEKSCKPLVSSWFQDSQSRFSILDYRWSDYFTVSMTKLRTADSGFYYCGIIRNQRVNVIRNVHLRVYQAPAWSPPKTPVRTTTLVLAISLTTDSSPLESPSDSWKFILPGVAALLLGILTAILVLYLRRARARKGENETHHIWDNVSVQKEMSAGLDRQMGSEEDTGAICYASLIHLNHLGAEDRIYANTHPTWRHPPDPFLFVEYVSVARSKPPPSKPAVPEGSLGN